MFDALAPDDVLDFEDFVAFVRALAADRRSAALREVLEPSSPFGPDRGGWENTDIESFLEAAVAWVEDTKTGWSQGTSGGPSWRLFAAFLYAGKSYE